jgi:hypothetical protein
VAYRQFQNYPARVPKNGASEAHDERRELPSAQSPGLTDAGSGRRQHKLRAQVLIPKDSPIAQIEIEVLAALLDDWESAKEL